MPRKQNADPGLFTLTTEERMLKYGLWPAEFETAIQMDKDYNLEELRTFCREEGLRTGGEKKRLIANLIIARRQGSVIEGMDSETGGGFENTSGVLDQSQVGNHGIVFEKGHNAPM
jgi:hypothetical protein